MEDIPGQRKWQRPLLCCGLALLWPVAAPCQQDSSASAQVLAEIRGLINEGKPAAAIERLHALQQPEDVRVRHLLGVAYYHLKEYVHAIEQLAPSIDRLLEGSMERREAVQVLGLCYYLAGRSPESIPFLEQTRLWAPDNVELAYVLGMACAQSRQPDRARQSFARMFQVPPESAAAHLLTGQMMIRAELEDFAFNELKVALQKDSRLPQTRFLLGELAIYRGRFEEGLSWLQQELEINPDSPMAWYRLGDAYTRLLRWDEAVAPLQKSIWLSPYYSGPYILLGKTYLKKNQLDAAEGMLRRGTQIDPNNKSAHYLLGQVLQKLGRHEEAKQEFALAERLRGEPER